MSTNSHNSMYETPTRTTVSRFQSKEGFGKDSRAISQSAIRSPSQRLRDLFFATYTSGVDPQTSQKSIAANHSFLTSATLQTPTKSSSSNRMEGTATVGSLGKQEDDNDSMDVDLPAVHHQEAQEEDAAMAVDALISEDDLRGPAVPLAINTTGRFYSEHMRRCELRIELMRLNTLGHNPRGIYVMPSLGSINVWYGVMYVKRGYWRDAVIRFRVDIPREYPKTHPIITLSTSVAHPLVRMEDGRFALEHQFPQWTPYSDYIFHALNYLKNAFKNRVLKQLRPKDCYNIGAYMKFKNNLPQFRDHARVDVMKSRTPDVLYRQQPSDCPIVFSPLSDEQFESTMQQMRLYAGSQKP